MSDDLSDLALAEALRRAWFGPDEDFLTQPALGGRWYKVAREARNRLSQHDEYLVQAIESEATQAIAAEAEIARQVEDQLRAAVNVLIDLVEHWEAGADWKGGIIKLPGWFQIMTSKITRARNFVRLVGDIGGDE